jgi:hypothetical protein
MRGREYEQRMDELTRGTPQIVVVPLVSARFYGIPRKEQPAFATNYMATKGYRLKETHALRLGGFGRMVFERTATLPDAGGPSSPSK